MTDHQIIEYLQQDKYAAALNGLYDVLPQVKKYIRTNNGNADDAQDIFQDALVILYKKIKTPGFTLTVPLKTYLMGIVKNCWFAELRYRKKIPVAAFVDDVGDMQTEEEGSFRLAEKAFQSLGEKCRQLLMLFYFNKSDYKTIATALAFGDERTAKNQKYRCLQKAKEQYVTLSKTGQHE